ncbi:hypothetical protein Tco_1232336 [Tanacetum coccineum]
MLYIRGKDNGEMLKDSVVNGPYKFKSEINAKDTYGVIDIRHEEILQKTTLLLVKTILTNINSYKDYTIKFTMATIVENVIDAGSKTRPPILEKGMYDSWKNRIMLYIQGKENGEMLRDSVENGPYKFKSEITIKDTHGITDIRRAQRLEDLKGDDKLRYDSDIKVVNINLLGLPMTKQERESMLYDEFDKFTSEPGESIHSYYLRFAKLIIDMNMIFMIMTPMQINMKFVNHLQLECCRYATAAKQARNLHKITFDQLYAFLKHNEKDAKEVREMRQRFLEPLALLANTYNPPPSYSSNQTQYQPQPSKVYKPYQHYQSSTLITQQLIQSPPLQSYAPTVVQQPPTYQPDIGLAIPTFLPTYDRIASLNKAMIFLSLVYRYKFPPTNNQL